MKKDQKKWQERGKTLEEDTERGQETDMMTEDKEMKVKAQGDTGAEIIVRGMRAAAEEVGEGDQEMVAQVQEVRTTTEEEATMVEEEEELAMERNENSAQRPKVMGGLLQAYPWLGKA